MTKRTALLAIACALLGTYIGSRLTLRQVVYQCETSYVTRIGGTDYICMKFGDTPAEAIRRAKGVRL